MNRHFASTQIPFPSLDASPGWSHRRREAKRDDTHIPRLSLKRPGRWPRAAKNHDALSVSNQERGDPVLGLVGKEKLLRMQNFLGICKWDGQNKCRYVFLNLRVLLKEMQISKAEEKKKSPCGNAIPRSPGSFGQGVKIQPSGGRTGFQNLCSHPGEEFLQGPNNAI